MQIATENLNFSREDYDFLLSVFSSVTKEDASLKKRMDETGKMLHRLIEQIKLSRLGHFGKKSKAKLDLGEQLELQFYAEGAVKVRATSSFTHSTRCALQWGALMLHFLFLWSRLWITKILLALQ